MTQRLRTLLEAAQIDAAALEPVKTGASGACVWKCMRNGVRCVAKYTEKSDVSEEIWRGSLREYDFLTADHGLEFLPEVLFARREEASVLIVEPEYRPVAASAWTDGLLEKAMEICAELHAAEIAPAADAPARETTQTDGWKPADALALWLRLAEKYPDLLDGALPKRICADFAAIPARAEAPGLDHCTVHGDCHPENFLLDGEKMRLCDWQGVRAGCGVDDVSFFLSRGADMGIKMDENALVEAYLAALARRGVRLTRQAFDRSCAAATLTTSFLFWAMYLQDAPEARVSEIWRPMAQAYRTLFA